MPVIERKCRKIFPNWEFFQGEIVNGIRRCICIFLPLPKRGRVYLTILSVLFDDHKLWSLARMVMIWASSEHKNHLRYPQRTRAEQCSIHAFGPNGKSHSRERLACEKVTIPRAKMRATRTQTMVPFMTVQLQRDLLEGKLSCYLLNQAIPQERLHPVTLEGTAHNYINVKYSE